MPIDILHHFQAESEPSGLNLSIVNKITPIYIHESNHPNLEESITISSSVAHYESHAYESKFTMCVCINLMIYLKIINQRSYQKKLSDLCLMSTLNCDFIFGFLFYFLCSFVFVFVLFFLYLFSVLIMLNRPRTIHKMPMI